MTLKRVFICILSLTIIVVLVLLIKSVLTNDEPGVNIEYNTNKDKILQSIEDNDSIIVELKNTIKCDEFKIKAMDDSSTVQLFYQLAMGE